MYAIIELQWHQYIVSKWDVITVDQMDAKKWAKVDVDTVLSVFDAEGKDVKVGTPYVAKAKVSLKVVENKKWDKIDVVKFKRKNRYERHIWFRPLQTVLSVESIG